MPAAAPAEPPATPDDGRGVGLEGGTIATLQRLFPGHVVRVEPAESPVEETADTDIDIESDTESDAERNETTPREGNGRPAEPADQDPTEHGLESPGSQRT